eukprot:14633120-Alexandrium_andersonii.AAC.1
MTACSFAQDAALHQPTSTASAWRKPTFAASHGGRAGQPLLPWQGQHADGSDELVSAGSLWNNVQTQAQDI